MMNCRDAHSRGCDDNESRCDMLWNKAEQKICSCPRKRVYIPDRNELVVARCTKCNGNKRIVKSVAQYNSKRTAYRVDQHLETLAAPLDIEPVARMHQFATANGIESDTPVIHVTRHTLRRSQVGTFT